MAISYHEQVTAGTNADGAARRETPDFGLSARALEFAKLYAANPRVSATKCALKAGYAQRCKRGAHVRGNELLKDSRVRRAVLYFGATAINITMSDTRQYLNRFITEEGYLFGGWYFSYSMGRLTTKLDDLDSLSKRLERIYTQEVYMREHREYIREWYDRDISTR